MLALFERLSFVFSESSTQDRLDRLEALAERSETLRQVVFVAITLLGMGSGPAGNRMSHRRGSSWSCTGPPPCAVETIHPSLRTA
jgi:hypothetical protein